MGFWDGSGISWTVCKQSAPRSRQITTPTPHHSILTGRMLFLTPSEQCQSTEGITVELHWRLLCWQLSCSYQYAYKLIICTDLLCSYETLLCGIFIGSIFVTLTDICWLFRCRRQNLILISVKRLSSLENTTSNLLVTRGSRCFVYFGGCFLDEPRLACFPQFFVTCFRSESVPFLLLNSVKGLEVKPLKINVCNASCKYIQLLFSAFITCSVVVLVYFHCNFVLLNPNAKLNNMLLVFRKLEDGCKFCPQISQISIAEMIEIAMDCCSHYCVLFLWFCLAV